MGESGTIDRKRPLIRLRPFMYGDRGQGWNHAITPVRSRSMMVLAALVTSCIVLVTTTYGASPSVASSGTQTAGLPIPGSLGSDWSTLLPPRSIASTNLAIGDGCGNVHSGVGRETEAVYNSSSDLATLSIALISVPNAAWDFRRFKQVYLKGCLEAARLRGSPARSHYRPVPQLVTSTGVGIEAKTSAFGRDTYEILYCTWKGSVLAVFYYRGYKPDLGAVRAAATGFRQ